MLCANIKKFYRKETIPYHLKNTNQKVAAINDINQLIDGVTDLSYLEERVNQTAPEDSYKSSEVYGYFQICFKIISYIGYLMNVTMTTTTMTTDPTISSNKAKELEF